MTKAHKFSASQVADFPNVLKSQETMDLMIPGRVAGALPAKLARARQRACMSFLPTPWPRPCRVAWELGDGVPLAPPPVRARTRVLIAMSIAVRMLTIIIPCSRKSVRMRSASVSSSWRSRQMVSRIRLICDRRAALFAEMASSLACRSSSMSESSPCSLLIRDRISSWISVSSVSVSFQRSLAKYFSISDLRSSVALSFARRFRHLLLFE